MKGLFTLLSLCVLPILVHGQYNLTLFNNGSTVQGVSYRSVTRCDSALLLMPKDTVWRYSSLNTIPITNAGSIVYHKDSKRIAWGNGVKYQLALDVETADTTYAKKLPDQSGHTGEFLVSDGTNPVWAPAPGTNKAAAYGSGTPYSLTLTPAKIDFGTDDPVITLPAAGTYLIMATVRIDYANLSTSTEVACDFNVRRTNNSASNLANAETRFIVPDISSATQTGGYAVIQSAIYTTGNNDDVLEIWGANGAGISSGTVDIGEASIVAIRLH